MGMVPELPIAMLACARLGAPHTVVFGGFSAESLSGRLNDMGCELLITQDEAWRKGSPVPLKRNVDDALAESPTVKKAIVLRRTGNDVPMQEGRDEWWHELVAEESDDPASCPCEPMDSEDLLYLLYTSGTTAKPKGIVHTTGGYLVGVATTHHYIFDVKPDSVYWCAADVGWVTGHSYIVYGPLCNGTTGVMYEGVPDYPDRDRWWAIVERYGVDILYTAPTAIRTHMKWGPEHAQKHDLSSIRLLGSVGEPINPEAWIWYRERHRRAGAGRRHVVADRDRDDPDHAAAGRDDDEARLGDEAVPGRRRGGLRRAGQRGRARRRRLPRAAAAVAGDAARDPQRPRPLRRDVLVEVPGRLLRRRRRADRRGRRLLAAGPRRRRDERLRPPDLDDRGRERARRSPGVAEAAAVAARADATTGQAIVAFVSLKGGEEGSVEMLEELRNHVAKKIGPIAKPANIVFTPELPKTRSGKIMRRLLRDVAENRPLGDTTTLADPTVVEEIRDRSAAEAPEE